MMAFYEENGKEVERLDLSLSDFSLLAVKFIADGGGTTQDFREWLQALSFESARGILYWQEDS